MCMGNVYNISKVNVNYIYIGKLITVSLHMDLSSLLLISDLIELLILGVLAYQAYVKTFKYCKNPIITTSPYLKIEV